DDSFWVRRRIAKGSKRRRFRKVRWEIANIGLHRRVPKTLETKYRHFLQSALRSPALKSNAVCGDENAGAIVAKPAMDIDFFSGLLLKKREELNQFPVLGRRPAAGMNVDESHAERFRTFSLRCNSTLAFAAKIHNGGDADFFQILDALFIGLRTTV